MDPFEEFEFKPLTKGLGFHKKSSELKRQMLEGAASSAPKTSHDLPESAPLMSDEESDLVTSAKEPKSQKEAYADLLKALEKPMSFDATPEKKSELEMTETLPRRDASEISAAGPDVDLPDMNMPELPPMNEMPEMVESSVEPSFEEKKAELFGTSTSRGASNSPKVKTLEPASVGVAAGILDCIFVVALSLIFLVSLIMVTGVNLSSVIFNTQTDITTQVSMGILFIAVMQMYVIVARSFFGRTLGEWTFDMQLGDDNQHKTSSYPLRVLLRSLVTIVTGIFLLPLLSLLFRKDLAGFLSGLQLYRQKG